MDGHPDLISVSTAARKCGVKTQTLYQWIADGTLAVARVHYEFGRPTRLVDGRAVAALKAARARKKLATADRAAEDAARVSEQVARYGVTAAEVIGANAVMYGLLTQDDVRELERRREKCHANGSPRCSGR